MAAFGENNGQAKLTKESVLEIRKLRNEGVLEKQVAWKFGITRGTVSKITHRRAWKHVS